MAQRCAIARALINRPKILLLDEPFGALDAMTKIYLQEELLKIHKHNNSTMIMVTHDIEEAIYLAAPDRRNDATPWKDSRNYSGKFDASERPQSSNFCGD